MLTVMNLYFIPISLNEISAKTVVKVLMIHMLNYMFLMLLKTINVKVSNLMSRDNELRHLE